MNNLEREKAAIERPLDCGCLPGEILCDDIGPVLTSLQKEFFVAVSTGDWREFDGLRDTYARHMVDAVPKSGPRRIV